MPVTVTASLKVTAIGMVVPAPYIPEGCVVVTAVTPRAMNVSAEEVGDVPSGPVTVTSTVPAGSAGIVAVIWVPAVLTTTLVAGVVPKSTAVVPAKPVPVTVAMPPPVVGPEIGLTAVTAGS